VSSAGAQISSCVPKEKNKVDQDQVALVTMCVEFTTNAEIMNPEISVIHDVVPKI
jgi:hypothetical protein